MDENRLRAVDTVWCRLLCVLERLEIRNSEGTKRTTLCHDVHTDKEKPTESEDDILGEFSLQLLAFRRAIGSEAAVKNIFLRDFALWAAGRAGVEPNAIDKLAEQIAEFLVGATTASTQPRDKKGELEGDQYSPPSSLGGPVDLISGKLPHSHERGGKKEAEVWLSRIDKDIAAPFLDALRDSSGGENEAPSKTHSE